MAANANIGVRMNGDACLLVLCGSGYQYSSMLAKFHRLRKAARVMSVTLG